MTKTVFLTGKCKWAKLKDPDMKFGGHWTIDLYLDEQGLKNFKTADLELELRSSDEGQFIKLRRPISRHDRKKDEIVKFDPPVLLDADGNELDALVGNGSEVACKVSVFSTAKGNGHRLEGVKVLKLEEFGGVIGDNDDFAVF